MSGKGKEGDIQEIKRLIGLIKERLLEFVNYLNEDRQTSDMYLNEIIRMLTTGEEQIPLLPIEVEVQNFKTHRHKYWNDRDMKLKILIEDYQKITELFGKILPQNEKDLL